MEKNGNQIDQPGGRRNYILFTIAVFASFAIFGLADNIRGTAIPRIQAEFLLTELHLGLLLAASSVGYLVTCTFTAAIARRIGIKTCHIIGLLIIAASGACIYYAPSFATLVLAFFILNLGFGMLEISVGVIAATIFTKKTGTMMNLSHFFYGAGATFSPIISTSIMAARLGDQFFNWRYVYIIVLSFAFVPAIPALFGRFRKRESGKKKTGYALLLRKPSIWLLVMLLSLGLVCEAGIGSWLVIFLEASYSFTGESAALHLTLYFVCFTLGRLLLGPLIDRLGFINSLAIGTAFAGLMVTTGVLLGPAGSPLLILAGIGVAPLFPTVMAVIAKLFSDQIDLAMTAVLTIVGVIVVPVNFLVGGIINQARVIFTDAYGGPGLSMAYAAGFLFLGLCCFGAFASALALRAKQKKAGKLV